GKNSGQMANTHTSSSSGKTGFDSLQADQAANNQRDQQHCCVLL
ncbi:unnamed protein product, partial [Rotaria socialis]